MFGGKVFVKHKWLKSESVESRLYQNEIIKTIREKNALVVLPTALGKTVIALLLAVDKADFGKIFFLAPTKPLVQQHYDTFAEKTLFELEDLGLITGLSPPSKRKNLYNIGRIFFATPQCIRNDVKNGILTLKDVGLIIFDEAHRARGSYAYVSIARHYFEQCHRPLVLGLTASPGSEEKKILEICSNLGIEVIEYRSDEDKDVKRYIHPIEVEWNHVKLPDVYLNVRDAFKKMVTERIKALQSQGVLARKKPEYITRRDLVEFNRELQRSISEGRGGYLYQMKTSVTAVLSILHMVRLIETQGSEALGLFIEKSLKRMALEGSRGHKSIVADPLFMDAKYKLEKCEAVENPKLLELLKVLKRQIGLGRNSRILVFTQYRDTVRLILKALNEISEINAERFVGQGEREDDPGMTQRQQKETLGKLRSGEFNVLVATSIAEEGLDIPEVDHVVFFEPVPSEIRYIQRRGRTGRKVAGKVSILIAENTVDEAFYWASVKRAKKMKKIISKLNKRLPEMLRTGFEQKPLTRLISPTLEEILRTETPIEKIEKSSLWKPTAITTKGLDKAVKWLVQNVPNKTIEISDLIIRAVEETGIDRATFETALWRLIQKGHFYQPEPGKVSGVYF